MTEIVTLAEAKLYLRVTSTAEDGTIALLIASATESVREAADAWDGSGEAPARLKLAVLSRVAIAYDDRGSVAAGAGEDRLIAPLREIGC